MQKIRCPRCGVVNLEKFVTYPQCVGCGTTLPTPSKGPAPFWKRPLGAFLWVSVFGVATAAFIIATSFFTTPVDDEAQLVVYGIAPRRITMHQTIIIRMTVDGVSESRAQQRSSLQNVKLRLPRTLFTKFAFVSLDPKPDTISSTAGGRYFHYNSLPHETALKLRLYARAAGRHRARAAVYADEHLPGNYGFTILVAPARK